MLLFFFLFLILHKLVNYLDLCSSVYGGYVLNC